MYLSHPPLTIRNAEAGDSAQLAAWWNDGAVMAHAGFPNGLGITPERVAAQLAHDSDAQGRRLVIEHDAVPIGEMSYRALGAGAVEIGIKICRASYRQRGFGRVLLSMLIGALFSMGFSRVVLDTDLENLRAQHVYELLGFERLRVNRDSWTDQLGRPRSSVDYALTPERFVDWTKNNNGVG